MVLLTSSTVSMIISTGVICTFTLLLFLSGYVLQQQSVRSIQDALRPDPEPNPILNAAGRGSAGSSYQKVVGDSFSDLIPDKKQDGYSSQASRGNYAYLQLLSTPDPSNICSAILFFKQLATNGTVVQDRLFMYPQEWDQLSASKLSEPVATALSLLRSASLKYNIWLLPIDMTPATSAGYTTTDTKLLRLGQIQFLQYDSVLYVHTPGVLLDTEKLDEVLLSRPLPLRHDKNRKDSYNNPAWIPFPLRADRDDALPPVYLITVNNIGAGNIEARAHIPNVALPGFGQLISGPWGAKASKDADYDRNQQPGYVFFEHDHDGHVQWKGNPLFGAWRAQQNEVCEGLDLDYVVHDEQ